MVFQCFRTTCNFSRASNLNAFAACTLRRLWYVLFIFRFNMSMNNYFVYSVGKITKEFLITQVFCKIFFVKVFYVRNSRQKETKQTVNKDY